MSSPDSIPPVMGRELASMKLSSKPHLQLGFSGGCGSEVVGACAEEPVTEHLLSISDERNGSRKRSSSAKVSIVRLERVVEPGNTILSGVSVEIPVGKVVGIIGPSGSGKSTLLRAINRLWEPPVDTVFLDGEDVTKMNVLAVRRRIGMLFQTPMLFDGTVADNVRYGPSLQGKKLTDADVEGLLALADLEPSFAQKSIIGLSVGQAQRVALARTLANEPEVLLLDEPTSALDPISTRHIEDSVLGLRRSHGLTVIMVSHSIDQIKRMADLVCLVAAGELLEVLKPEDLNNAKNPIAQEFLLQLNSGDLSNFLLSLSDVAVQHQGDNSWRDLDLVG